jgi:hypothetical protein
MLRRLQILICEALFRTALMTKPGDYELAAMRKLSSDTAKATRNDLLMRLREPSNKMLAAAAAAMSPTKRPTQDWVTVKEKHRIRYRAMIDAALALPQADQS